MAANVDVIASSLSSAKSATRGGGTTLMMCPRRWTPQTCSSRKAAKESSSATDSINSLSYRCPRLSKVAVMNLGSLSACVMGRHPKAGAETRYYMRSDAPQGGKRVGIGLRVRERREDKLRLFGSQSDAHAHFPVNVRGRKKGMGHAYRVSNQVDVVGVRLEGEVGAQKIAQP